MKIRIYKALLNGKETMDSYTVWFKPTKKAAQNGAIINAWCCNALNANRALMERCRESNPVMYLTLKSECKEIVKRYPSLK